MALKELPIWNYWKKSTNRIEFHFLDIYKFRNPILK